MIKQPSSFHFVLNTNISHYDLALKTREQRQDIINILQRSSIYLRDNIAQFLKEDKGRITEFSANLEIGKERKFLHIDGIIHFDKYVQLNFKEITAFYNQELNQYSKGTYLNVKCIHDNLKAVQDYSEKDGIKLV